MNWTTARSAAGPAVLLGLVSGPRFPRRSDDRWLWPPWAGGGARGLLLSAESRFSGRGSRAWYQSSSVRARSACRSRMIVRSWPEARSPGPRGPDEFSPTGGRVRRAARTSADIWSSCQRISSAIASGRSGSARPAALTAYAAVPSACAPMWQTATAWPAARAAAAPAGVLNSPAPTPPENRRRISSAVLSSPQANARARAIRVRGRSSSGASASKSGSTRSAQSAAHAATRRRSASLSVCGDPTTPSAT